MALPPPPGHFEGKSVVEHLREARNRGAMAAAEIHGTEMPGHIAAFADSLKGIAIALTILWIIFSHTLNSDQTWTCLLLFSMGWVLWKTGRSALLGWARVERLHRVIEQERWEIEHHRAQEKIELTEMYLAKGLSGKLLEEVIEVLMADDNRLLRVMLEEELGLTLEVYEHPLKQAFGAFCGASVGAALCLFGYWAFPLFGLFIIAGILITIASTLSAKLEQNHVWNQIVWNLAIAGVTAGSIYFLIPLLRQLSS
jgi:vacuolar iron transporter family protein